MDRHNYTLYLLHITPSTDERPYYKVGLTSQLVYERFVYERIPPYTCVKRKGSLSKAEAFDLESALKSTFRARRYIPGDRFGGSRTECFRFDPDDLKTIEEVFKLPPARKEPPPVIQEEVKPPIPAPIRKPKQKKLKQRKPKQKKELPTIPVSKDKQPRVVKKEEPKQERNREAGLLVLKQIQDRRLKKRDPIEFLIRELERKGIGHRIST